MNPTLIACVEIGGLNQKHIVRTASEWHAKDRRFLFMYGRWFQAIKHRVDKETEVRVYTMTVDGSYLKLAKRIYQAPYTRARWQRPALLAAGLTEEEITAARCAARMGVHL